MKKIQNRIEDFNLCGNDLPSCGDTGSMVLLGEMAANYTQLACCACCRCGSAAPRRLFISAPFD